MESIILDFRKEKENDKRYFPGICNLSCLLNPEVAKGEKSHPRMTSSRERLEWGVGLHIFRSGLILTEGSAVGEFSPSPPPPTQDEEFSSKSLPPPEPRHSLLYSVTTKVAAGKMAR